MWRLTSLPNPAGRGDDLQALRSARHLRCARNCASADNLPQTVPRAHMAPPPRPQTQSPASASTHRPTLESIRRFLKSQRHSGGNFKTAKPTASTRAFSSKKSRHGRTQAKPARGAFRCFEKTTGKIGGRCGFRLACALRRLR